MCECKTQRQLLLLDKGEEDIYVETAILQQHQYDGIRFLYRQFKKGKAGAILNDPKGYGKRVQIALFISAMSPVMTLPILILCPESKEQIWIDLFEKLTNMGSDVTTQKSNEIAKSACVVSVFSHLSSLSRREWSILVVDDDVVSREVLHSKINTKYKIWITTLDMKKNLQTFSLIYKWFYPKDRFVVEDFQTTTKTPTNLLAKSARLDAFMEDIVVRRKGVSIALGKSTYSAVHPEQVTKKNKDSTGRKIKRSKVSKPEPEGQTCSESQEFRVEAQKDKSDSDNFDEGQKSNPVMECDKPSDTYKLLSSESIESQNIIIKYDSDTPNIGNEFEHNIPKKKPKTTNQINFKNNQIESEDLFSADALISANKYDETDCKNNKFNSSIYSEDTNEVKDEVKNNDINRNKDEIINKNIVSENNKTDPKLEGVELKIKQMEELAMKKFKGSFLDHMI